MFIEGLINGTFAKTYANTWPHHYIVQEKVDNKMFSELAEFIDNFGHLEFFYKTRQKYIDYNGYTYWHMGNIINRCIEKDTFHRRKIDGQLPKT
jgi:hypothetical protein